MASENLNLSFEQSGIVRQVFVEVGNNIESGKFMASQDASQLSAQLTTLENVALPLLMQNIDFKTVYEKAKKP